MLSKQAGWTSCRSELNCHLPRRGEGERSHASESRERILRSANRPSEVFTGRFVFAVSGNEDASVDKDEEKGEEDSVEGALGVRKMLDHLALQ